EKAFAEGRFREARPLLIQAVNLSLDSPERAARAKQRIEQVDEYVVTFQKERDEINAAAARAAAAADPDEAREGIAEAWRLAAKIFVTHLDSDLTKEVTLPVPVLTNPKGASLFVGTTAMPNAAPTLL